MYILWLDLLKFIFPTKLQWYKKYIKIMWIIQLRNKTYIKAEVE